MKYKLLAVLFLVLFVTGCYDEAEYKQREETEKILNEAQRQIGMPDIVNFQEKRFAKQILEMRDRAIVTYTYFIDMNGRKHFICESVGYGLPYSVQYTNPMKKLYEIAIPQADPNGLYMPDGLSATWVLCSDGKGGVKPVYVEPQIIVSPFKMD